MLSSTAAVPKNPRRSDLGQDLGQGLFKLRQLSSRLPVVCTGAISVRMYITAAADCKLYFLGQVRPGHIGCGRPAVHVPAQLLLVLGIQPVAHGHGLAARHRARCGRGSDRPGRRSAGRGRPASAGWRGCPPSSGLRAAGGRRRPRGATTRHITSRSSSIMSCCRRSNIFTAGPSATIVEAVVGVAGVAGEHELGHDQPAGDRPQLGLQHGHVAAGVDARGGKFVFGAGHGVEDRARARSGGNGWSGRWPALVTREVGLVARRTAPGRRRWPRWCLRMMAMADWISATTLMLRSSFSARRRFLRTG